MAARNPDENTHGENKHGENKPGEAADAPVRHARVCFVCLGNICRSPTAEGIFRQLVERAGLGERIEIDSAGTSAYHAGASPDPRSTAAAARHGVTLAGRSRQFVVADFDRFDHVIAMDRQNLQALIALARTDADRARLSLLRQWAADGSGPKALEPAAGLAVDVPDPYYGSGDGFERVFQICHRGCEAVLAALAGLR